MNVWRWILLQPQSYLDDQIDDDIDETRIRFTGQAYSVNTASHFPFKPPRYGQFGEGGKQLQLQFPLTKAHTKEF